MVDYYPSVDLDLFVNMFSKGVADAARTPSAFASFATGLIEGFDAEEKAEAVRQQNELRQIEIENAPLNTQLKQDAVDKNAIEMLPYREDPEGYKAQVRQKNENDMLQEQQEETLRRQQIEFTSIMQSGDKDLLAEAVVSGKFGMAIAATPNLSEQLKLSSGSWRPDLRDQYWEAQRQEMQIKHDAQQKMLSADDYEKSLKEFYGNRTANSLIAELSTGKDRISHMDLLNDAEIRVEKVPKGKPQQVTEEVVINGVKTERPVLNSDGLPKLVGGDENPTMFFDPMNPEVQDAEVLYFRGKKVRQVRTKEADFVKDFGSAQAKWYSQENQGPAHPTSTWSQRKRAEELDKEREALASIDAAKAERDAATDAEYTRQFNTGINKQYLDDDARARAQVERNAADREARRAAAEGTPAPEMTATPESTGTPEATATSRTQVEARLAEEPAATRTPERTAAPAPVGTTSTPTPAPSRTTAPGYKTPSPPPVQTVTSTPTQAPATPTAMNPLTIAVPTNLAAKMTPSPTVTSSPTTPVAVPTGTPKLESTWEKAQDVNAAAHRVKAETLLQRSAAKKSATPSRGINEPVPSPVEQARKVSTPLALPREMKVVNAVAAPDDEAVKRVLRKKELRDQPALLKALAAHESRGIDDAVSPTGASGLLQFERSTMEWLAPGFDRNNPADAARASAFYIESFMAIPQFNNNPMLALTAYNLGAGPTATAVEMAGGSTDWQTVKKFIGPATTSKRWERYWQGKGFSPKQVQAKAIEASTFAEKVMVNFPLVMESSDDLVMARSLKRQGILDFDE